MTRHLASFALIGCLLLPSGSVSAGADPYVGEIAMYGFNFPPSGWAHCNGQILSIDSNSALFALLGTTYGGDGRTTFGLPDFRGRVPMHFGSGPGLTPRSLGERSGSESNFAVVAHTHGATATAMGDDGRGDVEEPGGNLWARKARERDYSSAPPEVTLVPMHSEAVDVVIQTTGSASVNNMQPYLVVNFSIALQGIFPSQN